MKYVARRDLVPFPPPHREKKKKKKTHVTHSYQKEENHPSDPPLKKKVQLTKKNISREFKDSNQGRYAILKKEKQNKTKGGKKKGETARVQSLFIA